LGRGAPPRAGAALHRLNVALADLDREEQRAKDRLAELDTRLIQFAADREREQRLVADAEEARRLLSAHPYMEDEGAKGGARRFIWHLSREVEDKLRRGEHMGPQDRARTFSASPKGMTEERENAERKQGNVMRSFGSLELRGKRLTFETQSRPRLKAGRRELEEVLAGVAIHRMDSVQDQEALLGEAWRNRGSPWRGSQSCGPLVSYSRTGA
jgi:chromosome segregation protein